MNRCGEGLVARKQHRLLAVSRGLREVKFAADEVGHGDEVGIGAVAPGSGLGSLEEVPVEGRRVRIAYCQDEGAAEVSPLEQVRNYENAIKAMQGRVAYSNDAYELHAVLMKDGKEIWLKLVASGNEYTQTTVERQGMVQSLQIITSDTMKAALDQAGRVALDVHFDTAKATIRPDSLPIIAEIVKLLEGNPALALRVEGHTDTTGNPADNRTLSQARVQAVVAALTDRGITASRLTAEGFGQDRPVADNATEEGRARNRRVELVKK